MVTTTATSKNILGNFLLYHNNSENRPFYRSHLQNTLKFQFASQLQFCDFKEIDTTVHKHPILSIHIDRSDCRFLLSGGADMTIGIYDLNSCSAEGGKGRQSGDEQQQQQQQEQQQTRMNKVQIIGPMVSIPSSHPHAHKYSITCVEWYPYDTGMFFTSSNDHFLKVWDTNELQVACQFKLPAKVFMFSQSTVATQHTNVACACAHSHIRLCDVNSGSSAQTLVGHKSDVLCVRWSPTNEYILASSSKDQSIKLWDIRKAGWIHSFDMFHTKRNPKSAAVQLNRKKFSTQKLRGDTRVPPAHNGSITDLQFSADGMYLLSTGTDNQLRRWEVTTGENTLVSYPNIVNATDVKHVNFVLSQDGSLVYHPNQNNIGVYETKTGVKLDVLQGHYGQINSLAFHPKEQELYSAGSDHQIFIWSPKFYQEQRKEMLTWNRDTSNNSKQQQQQQQQQQQYQQQDIDEWSSSDDEAESVGF